MFRKRNRKNKNQLKKKLNEKIQDNETVSTINDARETINETRNNINDAKNTFHDNMEQNVEQAIKNQMKEFHQNSTRERGDIMTQTCDGVVADSNFDLFLMKYLKKNYLARFMRSFPDLVEEVFEEIVEKANDKTENFKDEYKDIWENQYEEQFLDKKYDFQDSGCGQLISDLRSYADLDDIIERVIRKYIANKAITQEMQSSDEQAEMQNRVTVSVNKSFGWTDEVLSVTFNLTMQMIINFVLNVIRMGPTGIVYSISEVSDQLKQVYHDFIVENQADLEAYVENLQSMSEIQSEFQNAYQDQYDQIQAYLSSLNINRSMTSKNSLRSTNILNSIIDQRNKVIEKQLVRDLTKLRNETENAVMSTALNQLVTHLQAQM